jgi:glycosyltransferase involved in cell wall biosynthesis
MLPPLTVAIPTYSRWAFLRTLLPKLLEYRWVTNIIVCDDGGGDAMAIWSEPWGNHEKLNVHINDKRLGIFGNKRRCLELAKTEWVILLDSDNEYTMESFEFLEEYFRSRDLDARVIYAAGGMRRLENGKVSRPLEHFGNLEITRVNWETICKVPGSSELLNDGNFLVHVSALEYIPKDIPHDRYYAADMIAWLDLLINNGGWTYKVLKGLSYIHNVHNDSSWLKESSESWNAMKVIKEA